MFFRHNLLAIIWSIIIIILCSIPGQEFPDASFIDIPHFDKIVHFGLYFILSILSIKGLNKQSQINFVKQYPYSFIVIYAIILGISLELLQHYYIPFRSGDYLDMLANFTGTLSGTLVIKLRLAPKYFLMGK